MIDRAQPLLLASTSRTRVRMLTQAGLVFETEAPQVDESALRDELFADNPAIEPREVALVLASAKAEAVSLRYPGHLVIGADQVLVFQQAILEKARDLDDAQAKLLRLRGESHDLISAVAIAESGHVTWSSSDRARLKMRRFSVGFVTEYLARIGDAAVDSVGAYQIEYLGAQLFEEIDGGYFTILGLPLLPLLAELRVRKVIEE